MVKYIFIILPFFPHACITHNADNNPCRRECDPALLSCYDATSFSKLATTNVENGATSQQSVAEIVGSVIGCAVVVSLLFLVMLVIVLCTLHRKHCSIHDDGTHEVCNQHFCGKKYPYFKAPTDIIILYIIIYMYCT